MCPDQGHDKLLAFSSDANEPDGELKSGTQKGLKRKLGVGNGWGVYTLI